MSLELQEKTLFEECIEALTPNFTILSKSETDEIWQSFKMKVPFTKGSRINWETIDKKKSLNNLNEIMPSLIQLLQKKFDTTIYILWNDAELPIIKTTIESVLLRFDDVTCLSFETWFFNPFEGYVIEYYYLGELHVGLLQ